ncbi:hypothetical protein SNEBB_011452 [Seison nebaliae]|nr:hypothetical protein SNEBB_011452 [Seison nebaliae]
MTSIISLVVLAVAFVACTAQLPKPCYDPAEFEGRVFQMDQTKQEYSGGRLSYDKVNKRERFIEEVNIKKQKNYYDIIRLHNEDVEYVFNLVSKQCEKRQITKPWRDWGIPKNASSFGEAYIGSSSKGKDGVLITIWGGKTKEGISYFGEWTYDDCIPVHMFAEKKATGEQDVVSFFDVTLGIQNPNVFIPPKECWNL